MILSAQRPVRDAFVDAIRQRFDISEIPPFAIEVPPSRKLGDLAITVAFQLAKPLRKAPRAIAQELKMALSNIPGVREVAVAPNGYLNVFLDRPTYLIERVRGEVAGLRTVSEKTIVEHTAINPNKAAHVGHLRNATLGDTMAR